MSHSAPRPRRRRTAVVALLALSAGLAATSQASAATVMWGAYMKGNTYGYQDAPFDSRTIDTFESHAGKRVSIVHWGQPWYWGSHGGYQPFQAPEAERVRLRGSIPMITWTSVDHDKGLDQPDFQLADISGGKHDAYIHQWAKAVATWGHPLLIRFDHEMNGSWFSWSESRNGNSSGQFVPAWRHVVDIFRQEGATNATFVWAPNRVWSGAIPLAGLYPGDGYVDWVGMSAYNWGTNPAKPNNVWQTPTQVFKETYDALGALAPTKPIMIAETASTEYGGSKAAWTTELLGAQVPNWPRIKALLWFNWNAPATNGNMDWVIESSSSAQSAFKAGIASSVYATNTFASLPRGSKVVPVSTPSAATSSPGGTAAPGAEPRPGGAATPGVAGRVLAGRRPLSRIATSHVGRRVILAKVQVGGTRGTLRFIATVKRTVVGRCAIGRVGARRTVTCRIHMKRPYPLKRVRFTARFRSVTGTVAVRQAWVVS